MQKMMVLRASYIDNGSLLSLWLKSSSKYRRSGTNLSETGRQQNQDQTVDRIGLRIGSDRTSIFAFGAEELF